MDKKVAEEAVDRASFEDVKQRIEEMERTHYQQQELCEFVSCLPTGKYIHVPTRAEWPRRSVNAKLPPIECCDKIIPASQYLDQNNCVVQTCWAPGETQVIQDRIVADGGFVDAPGKATFNMYRPPLEMPGGDASKAVPWVDLVTFTFPEHIDEILSFFAHAVQKPDEKVNHALVLGSRAQGIGKDTIIAPVREAVGPWNCAEVTPRQLMDKYNACVKSVLLRVSEAKDLGDASRYEFYDHCKILAASPPEVLRCNEKYLRDQMVLNRCHLVITTNYLTSGLYLPPEDRRHYVAESLRTQEEFPKNYWTGLWNWYSTGGFGHVAAWLRGYDISKYDPKAPPAKTSAFHGMVGSHVSDECAMLADLLDSMDRPKAVTIPKIKAVASGDLAVWFNSSPSPYRVRHYVEDCGYRFFPNEEAKDKYWKIDGKRQPVYTLEGLDAKEQIAAKDVLLGLPKKKR